MNNNLNTVPTSRQGKRRGFVFLFTIIGMAVLLIIGAAFLGSASQQFSATRREYADLHAIALSNAGVHYAYWWTQYGGGKPDVLAESDVANPRPLLDGSATTQRTIELSYPNEPGDVFKVWVAPLQRTDTGDPSKKATGYVAISKGIFRANSAVAGESYYRAARAVWSLQTGQSGGDGPPVALKYALFSHKDLYISGAGTINGGDMGCNYGPFTIMNNVYLNGGSGKAFYSTDGQAKNPITNKAGIPVANGAPEAFTTWQWTKQDFKNAARWNYTGSNIPTNGNDFFPDTPNPDNKKNIAYITGNALFAKDYTFSKSGTIVVDGNLTVHGNIYTTNPNVSIVLYCLGNTSVKINGTATLNATLIAHNDGFSGTMDIKLNGGSTINGAILADQGIRMNGGFTINFVKPNDQAPVEPPKPPAVSGDGVFFSNEVL